MTSLASMLAASLPSQQVAAPSAADASAASAGVLPKDAIPKNMAHAVDVDAEISLEQVSLSPLVRFMALGGCWPVNSPHLRFQVGDKQDREAWQGWTGWTGRIFGTLRYRRACRVGLRGRAGGGRLFRLTWSLVIIVYDHRRGRSSKRE